MCGDTSGARNTRRHTDLHVEVGTYVDVPMGACVGTHLEQETRDLWKHVWRRSVGAISGRKHENEKAQEAMRGEEKEKKKQEEESMGGALGWEVGWEMWER